MQPRYRYDADNRLIRVETSHDGNIWDRDAKYYYYLHGPLARTETGEKMVQGTDYAYTIHGWLKGVNSSSLRVDSRNDMGKDGFDGAQTFAPINYDPYFSSNGWTRNNIHRNVAQDAFGFSLGYYNDAANGFNDYNDIGIHGGDFLADVNLVNSSNAGNNLYNGNIRHMAVDLMNTSSSYINGMAYIYQYDQLNRISSMNAWNATNGIFDNATHNTDYDATYAYDANGNLSSLNRNGYDHSPITRDMDNLTYNYLSGTNKLDFVTDAHTTTTGYLTDFESGQLTGNYTYDEMGNPGKFGICFALRNKENKVTGMYFRSTLNDDKMKHYYLKDRQGLYPNYPKAETKKLLLTEAIIDAATLLQIENINTNYSILSCYGTNGLTNEHKEAIKELKKLTEVIFAFDNDDAGNEAVNKYSNDPAGIQVGFINSRDPAGITLIFFNILKFKHSEMI